MTRNGAWRVCVAAGLLLVAMPANAALVINPIFVDGAGETWDATRMGVVNQAITDWGAVISDSHTFDITFTFANDGPSGPLGTWSGGISGVPVGTDLFPYTPQVNHSIRFNADLFSGTSFLWWDPSPTTSGDQPFAAWDALSVTRHEIAHALGFVDGFYFDNVGTGAQFDKWGILITGTTFDAGGLNVSMTSAGDLSHLLDGGATAEDLMVPSLVNSVRRDISQTDLDMLALAYGYTTVPEPVSIVLVASSLLGLVALRRRQRATG